MKCPKCGYLGFETTDRCRNCGYDFSLAPFSSEPDLTLRNADKNLEQPADFDLPGITRPSDSLNAGSLDLDRLFGEGGDSAPSLTPSGLTLPSHLLNTPPQQPPAPRRVVLPNTQVIDLPPPVHEEPVYVIDTPLPAADTDVAELALATEAPLIEPEPVESASAREPSSELRRDFAVAASGRVGEPAEPVEPAAPVSVLPFDDTPHVPPPPARTPLAVRRATPEIPRGRSRTTTRPVRTSSLLGLDGAQEPAKPAAAADTSALLDPPSLGARVGADAIDTALLAIIYSAVVVLTLRIAGLAMTVEDLKVVPPVPFVSFLILFALVYFAAFTVAGGQTIGKMLMGIKVIGDDGRSVDAAGGILRAIGCALVPLTLGLSYVPVLLTSDRRALHDRLAGTRVVSR